MATVSTVEEIGQEIGVRGSARTHGWLEYVVRHRMKRALAKARSKREAGAYADVSPEERARSVVRWACAKAAFTGALSGAASTGAIVVTAETDGVAGIVAVPLAAIAVGVEMAARTVFHVDLACELAEIFELRIDDADDVVRLLSLGPGGVGDTDGDDLGQSRLKSATVDSDVLFDRAESVLLGESVLRNLLPFVAIVSSAVANVVVTHRLGRMLRRSCRYERALLDVLRAATATCASCMNLLVEGLWFVFIADGRLSAEETACLAQRLDDLSEEERRQVLGRFTDDESGWLERLPSVPEGARETFLRVLEVAAALDKSLALPEEKLIRRVADTFHVPYDPQSVRRMIDQLEHDGVLS